MSLEDKLLENNFKQAVNEWKKHCYKVRHHSVDEPYLDCDAYRTIIAMGPKVLPLIRKEYAKPQGVGNPGRYWCAAIKEIVPEFALPIGEEGSGSAVEKVGKGFLGIDVDKVQRDTIKWLDENMSKYVSNL